MSVIKIFIKSKWLIAILLLSVTTGCNTGRNIPVLGKDISFNELLMPVPASARLIDDDYFIWCGSMIRSDDGVYHLFFSRWPRKNGFQGWVSSSEIGHAVADNPLGPYKFKDLALPPRGSEYWDGIMTHNPTVYRFGEKYYLYYVGNRGDGKTFHIHRNNQRIGVAVADQPDGPWHRFDNPLIDISTDTGASDGLMVTNPAVTIRPDGGFLMIYKAAAIDSSKFNLGGRVVHRVALSDSPAGPFSKQPGLVFDSPGSLFAAEDPYVWYNSGKYYAILKDMHGAFTEMGVTMLLFQSTDGLNWELTDKPLVSKVMVNWTDSTSARLWRLERPQVWFKKGRPAVLFVAAAYDNSHSFNLHIPLKSLKSINKK